MPRNTVRTADRLTWSSQLTRNPCRWRCVITESASHPRRPSEFSNRSVAPRMLRSATSLASDWDCTSRGRSSSGTEVACGLKAWAKGEAPRSECGFPALGESGPRVEQLRQDPRGRSPDDVAAMVVEKNRSLPVRHRLLLQDGGVHESRER